jgi:hypothetical protein
MAQLTLATKQAATDILSSIGTVAHGISVTVNSGVHYMEALEHISRGYRDEVIADEDKRILRRKAQAKIDNANFYLGIEDQLRDNPRLAALYNQLD